MSIRVTSKPWFGPKKYLGWGWRVVSWEGRVATAIFVALMITAGLLAGRSRVIALAVLIIAFGVVVLFTGDRPGGPSGGKRIGGNSQL